MNKWSFAGSGYTFQGVFIERSKFEMQSSSMRFCSLLTYYYIKGTWFISGPWNPAEIPNTGYNGTFKCKKYVSIIRLRCFTRQKNEKY